LTAPLPKEPLGKWLSDVGQLSSSSATGEFSYIDLSSVDKDEKTIVLKLVQRVSAEDAPSRARQIVRSGDILVSTVRPNLNGVAMVPAELDGAIASTGFCVLRSETERLDSKFLFHWVRSPQFIADMTRKATGASYPAVSDRIIHESLIPFPDPSQQERIATLLDKADGILRKRREALKLADEFLRSAFLDLFGDPVANPKGWSKDSFGNLGTLDRGKSRHRPRDEPTLYGGPHPFIQTGDVANCDGVVRRHTQTYSDFGLSQSRKWPAGTLAITIAANIGKTGVLGFDACFPDSVVGFTAKPPISAEFIQFWLGQIQNRLEETAPQSAQKNINLEILRDLPVPVPPEDLLKKFTALVLRTRESKQRQEALLKESDLLFSSIQQRAFNGELASA